VCASLSCSCSLSLSLFLSLYVRVNVDCRLIVAEAVPDQGGVTLSSASKPVAAAQAATAKPSRALGSTTGHIGFGYGRTQSRLGVHSSSSSSSKGLWVCCCNRSDSHFVHYPPGPSRACVSLSCAPARPAHICTWGRSVAICNCCLCVFSGQGGWKITAALACEAADAGC
jgi:hypothetical protein